MTVTNSLLVAVIVMAIVFTVLIALSLILKLQTAVLSAINRTNSSLEKAVQKTDRADADSNNIQISSGELKIIGTDERTAAMVMALASYELNIPLNELQFKSIKALD